MKLRATVTLALEYEIMSDFDVADTIERQTSYFITDPRILFEFPDCKVEVKVEEAKMTIDDRISTFKNKILNLADNTIRFQWSHQQWLQYRKESIFENSDYLRLPYWAKQYLRGYEDALLEQIWRKVVFSYIIDTNGTRATIDSDIYRTVSPSVISKCYYHTGCYVWRNNPSKFWTQPRK